MERELIREGGRLPTLLTPDPSPQPQVLKWPRADYCLGLFNTLMIWNKGPAGYEQRCDDLTEKELSTPLAHFWSHEAMKVTEAARAARSPAVALSSAILKCSFGSQTPGSGRFGIDLYVPLCDGRKGGEER